MMDRFFLGGPMTLRGFESRGIGNLNDNMVAGVSVIYYKHLYDIFKLIFVFDYFAELLGFCCTCVCKTSFWHGKQSNKWVI